MRPRDGSWSWGYSQPVQFTVQAAPTLDEQIATENAAIVAALQRKQAVDLEIAERLDTLRSLQARKMIGS